MISAAQETLPGLPEEPAILRPEGRCHLCGEAFGEDGAFPLIGHDGITTVALACAACAEGLGIAPEEADGDACEGCESDSCEGCDFYEPWADEEPWDGFRTDAEADGDALASCGWGTDEDYGCFGGEEY